MFKITTKLDKYFAISLVEPLACNSSNSSYFIYIPITGAPVYKFLLNIISIAPLKK